MLFSIYGGFLAPNARIERLVQNLFQTVEQFPIWTEEISALDIEITGVEFITLAAFFSRGMHLFRHQTYAAFGIDIEMLEHAA
ncbi:MAG: hypothetical protein CMM23_01770 [Rhodospirillaceae bacterium]|nr:hypothetical protein [Rhodospirillaceae bacterium]